MSKAQIPHFDTRVQEVVSAIQYGGIAQSVHEEVVIAATEHLHAKGYDVDTSYVVDHFELRRIGKAEGDEQAIDALAQYGAGGF